MGQGPQSGRGIGPCRGNNQDENEAVFGGGMGRAGGQGGRGGRRGGRGRGGGRCRGGMGNGMGWDQGPGRVPAVPKDQEEDPSEAT